MDGLVGSSSDCGNGNALKSLSRQYDRSLALRDNFLQIAPVSSAVPQIASRLKGNNQGDANILKSAFATDSAINLSEPIRRGSASLNFSPVQANIAGSSSWSNEFLLERSRPLEPKTQQFSRVGVPETAKQNMERVFESEFKHLNIVEPTRQLGFYGSNMLNYRQPLASKDSAELDRAFESAFSSFSTTETMESAWSQAEKLAKDSAQEAQDTFDNLGERFNQAWKDTDDLDDLQGPPLSGLAPGTSVDPLKATVAPYEFAKHNPFLPTSAAADPFELGVRLMNERASLTEAALAFEAAVQYAQKNGDRSKEVQAWSWLGLVQAENEREQPAIAALQRAVQGDPSNLGALMALSASLTNEGADLQAFGALERWVHTQYGSLLDNFREEIGQLTEQEFGDTAAYRKRVTDKFLLAARAGPTRAHTQNERGVQLGLDADVQVGLGVLFYNAGDYDKAVDCFEAAVKVRPDDYLLWNRLGATLANGGKSEEAISAHHRALSLKPTFVRGMYNLGVSCMNIGCYREAAEHFLAAIQMHQRPPSKQVAEAVQSQQRDSSTHFSDNLWEILRRTFILMDRPDLVEKAQPGSLVDSFRSDFTF